MNNLQFLFGRPPIVIPHGILPDHFVPQEGSIYNSFAPGLPAVIFINGQFYPLSEEELATLVQQFNTMASQKSSGGPESIPQVPQMPSGADFSNIEQSIETKQEQAIERSFEQKNEQKIEQVIQQPQPTAPAVNTSAVNTKPVVNLKDFFSKTNNEVNQDAVQEIINKFQAGKLTTSPKPKSDSLSWLSMLIEKILKTQISQQSSTN